MTTDYFLPIPYGQQTISDDDILAVVSALRSSHLTQGPLVSLFEEAFSSYVGSKFTIATNSATSALHIACLALELGLGDTLWTSPNTFVASANVALYCRAQVDFVDIDLETGHIDIDALEVKLEHAALHGTLPKVLIPVHYSGSSCDMSRIFSLSLKYNFFVVEDASHATGASYLDSRVGSCKYSHMSIFSLHAVKVITSGEGGVVTTNDSSLATMLYKYRSHGITKQATEFLTSDPPPWHYEQHHLGYNYRLTDFQAALATNQLSHLTKFVEVRTNIYNYYQQKLANLPCQLLTVPSYTSSSFHLVVLRLLELDRYSQINLYNYLRTNGIYSQVHYIPVHLQPFYLKAGFKPGDFPRAEHHARSCLSLPVFPTLTEVQLSYIVRTICNFFTK